MKTSSGDMQKALPRLQKRFAESRMSKAELARRSGVHPSQVGRILGGENESISQSVLQICNVLGINPYIDAAVDRERIAEAALSIWDGTHEGADALVDMLRQLARFKDRV